MKKVHVILLAIGQSTAEAASAVNDQVQTTRTHLGELVAVVGFADGGRRTR